MQLCLKYDKPTRQSYHEKSFVDYDVNWKLIYGIPHIATLETKIRIFECKLLNNVLYLNKKLFQFGIISQSKCSFCELYDETLFHILQMHVCTKFIEPTSFISFRKSCITSFKSTECHFRLY